MNGNKSGYLPKLLTNFIGLNSVNNMENLKSVKGLLTVIVVFFVFFVLKLLSFIFVPIVLALFISVLFLPLMRWLQRRNVPKIVGLLLVTFIIVGILVVIVKLIQLTSREILTANTGLFESIQEKLKIAAQSVEEFFLVKNIGKEGMITSYIKQINITETIFGFLKSMMDSAWNIISILLMTFFFIILLLSGSINVQKIMKKTLYKRDYTSIKVFHGVELSLITFLKVKFFVSLLAGVGIGISCMLFKIDFPIFWGLVAFALHFVQMIGALAVIVILSLFAFVEIQVPGVLLLFIMIITLLQVMFGSVLEPILMGRSFSINTITILIMLMFWGYLWGGIGLVLSVPITVFLKSVFEKFPGTMIIAEIMEGIDKNPIVERVQRKVFRKNGKCIHRKL
jgi:AI-2 transport protein TqsA